MLLKIKVCVNSLFLYFYKKIMRIKLFAYFILLLAILLWHEEAYSQAKSQDVLNYIERYKDIAMREMQEYKIPASITLAQGLLESGNGKSELSRKSNNHFGIKCHKDWTGKRTYHDDDEKGECFRVYDDPEQSYRDHSVFLRKGQRYAFLFDLKITDYKGWAKGLKQAGYATLPVYANILIKLIEEYNLTQYDEMVVKGKFKYKDSKTSRRQDTKPTKDEGQRLRLIMKLSILLLRLLKLKLWARLLTDVIFARITRLNLYTPKKERASTTWQICFVSTIIRL